MRWSILGTLLLAVALDQSSPKTMTKLIVRFESPDAPPFSFPALPKTMYRAGTRYCRIEELPDPEHGIHGLIVINEPDIWLANRQNKTVRHQTDPGPTFNCRLPMFIEHEAQQSALNTGNPLEGLEFGRELAFFKGKAAATSPGPPLQGKATQAYTLQIGASQLFLFTRGIPEKAVAVVKESASKREVYWYLVYEELPFDTALFSEPEGRMEEIR